MPEEDNVHRAVSSLRELASLETETLAAEINLLGVLRDRISPAARYGGPIQIKFRKLRQKTETEAEQTVFLSEGYPFTETGKPLPGLLVIDRYGELDTTADNEGGGRKGQYIGERIYLTQDRKWILAERTGTFTCDPGGVSEWDADCRIATDRSLLEKYSLDTISDGLFAATNRVWENLSPRMEALKRRYDKVSEVANALSRLKSSPLPKPAAPEVEAPALQGRTREFAQPVKRTVSER